MTRHLRRIERMDSARDKRKAARLHPYMLAIQADLHRMLGLQEALAVNFGWGKPEPKRDPLTWEPYEPATITNLDADHAVALERDALAGRVVEFSAALGFGDGKTEPAASLGDLIDPLRQALDEAREHGECPVSCEQCGDRVASQLCPNCGGSGIDGPASSKSMAHVECDWCGGAGKVHDCPGEPLAAVVAARDKYLAMVEAMDQHDVDADHAVAIERERIAEWHDERAAAAHADAVAGIGSGASSATVAALSRVAQVLYDSARLIRNGAHHANTPPTSQERG